MKGLKRNTANLHLLVSPFAQIKYEPDMLITEEKAANSLILKNAPYYFEFRIFNLLELVLFCEMGIYVFQNKI